MTNHVRTPPTISMFGMKSARRSILWPRLTEDTQAGAKPRDATAFTARLCLSTAPADRLAAVGVRRYPIALCANGTIGRRPMRFPLFYTCPACPAGVCHGASNLCAFLPVPMCPVGLVYVPERLSSGLAWRNCWATSSPTSRA